MDSGSNPLLYHFSFAVLNILKQFCSLLLFPETCLKSWVNIYFVVYMYFFCSQQFSWRNSDSNLNSLRPQSIFWRCLNTNKRNNGKLCFYFFAAESKTAYSVAKFCAIQKWKKSYIASHNFKLRDFVISFSWKFLLLIWMNVSSYDKINLMGNKCDWKESMSWQQDNENVLKKLMKHSKINLSLVHNVWYDLISIAMFRNIH